MTATIETIITCDGESHYDERNGCYANGDYRHETASEQRKTFGRGWWQFIGGKDYCPYCVAKLDLDSLGRLKTPRRKKGELTKAQLRKVGTLIAAGHVFQQDIFGEASVEACEATRQVGYSLLKRYKCEDVAWKLFVCEDIEEMVRTGEL